MFTQQRQKEIIKILLQDQKWYTLEEIAKHVQCAVKTVRRDLKYLKDQIPSDWRIHIIKGKGVKLYKPPYSSQTSMSSYFMQDDMQFRILDQMLCGDIRTVTDLADALYVQASTLSPVLRSIQKYLSYFDLQLHKKPLRIVGIEAHIVYMFYELYFTIYGWEKWPFPAEIEVFSYITQIENVLEIKFYPSYTQRLAYLLAIAVQRKKKGHNIRLLPVHEDLIIETPFYHKIKTLSHILCEVSLTKTDQILITIAVNCCMFVHSNQNKYKQEFLQYYYYGTSTVCQYAQNLVKAFENEFEISLQQDEDFLFYLLQYIKQIAYRYQFIPTIASPPLEWQEQIKQKHPATFQKVHRIYTAWIQQHPFISCVNEEDVLVITLQLEASFHLSQTYRKQVITCGAS
ncbi:helix-turn-helix domain-containing protein, partial [Bacillus mycoides]|uniref:helix-turn-helix domain-containing protein n=1 Tax=Bacillus mycoides TaxID=1405 RepID=UPI003D1A7372